MRLLRNHGQITDSDSRGVTAFVSMFRAQLLLEEQRRLFDVWTSAAGALSMPSRENFQPRAFGALLPFISLIEVKADKGLCVRVAGSALRDVFAADPRFCLNDHATAGGSETIARVVREGRPQCGVVPTVAANGHQGVRFWMRLPLGTDIDVRAVIGMDIALTGARAPDWALQQMAIA